MKQKDIAMIIAIVAVSAVFSLVVSRLVFAPPKNRQQKVESVAAISTDFPQPDTKYFNSTSVDPTQLISIGENTNSSPFNGSGH